MASRSLSGTGKKTLLSKYKALETKTRRTIEVSLAGGTVLLGVGGWLASIAWQVSFSTWCIFVGAVCYAIVVTLLFRDHVRSVWAYFTAVVCVFLVGAICAQVHILRVKEKEAQQLAPLHENTVSSSNQTGGFTGVNTGTVNLIAQIDPEKIDRLTAQLEVYNGRHEAELAEKFPLGYAVLTPLEGVKEVLAFDRNARSLTFDWRECRADRVDGRIRFRLPMITIQPSGSVVSNLTAHFPNQVGSRYLIDLSTNPGSPTVTVANNIMSSDFGLVLSPEPNVRITVEIVQGEGMRLLVIGAAPYTASTPPQQNTGFLVRHPTEAEREWDRRREQARQAAAAEAAAAARKDQDPTAPHTAPAASPPPGQ